MLIEDVCESHGATFNKKKLGTFGEISNFSFYYAHHMSTVEGGMVSTNNKEIYEKMRIMRNTNHMNYSSFWLDKSIWDTDNEPNKIEKKSNDLMKLMAYKKSISNFVSIVTGQPIPVTFNGRGDDSYTDGKRVNIYDPAWDEKNVIFHDF